MRSQNDQMFIMVLIHFSFDIAFAEIFLTYAYKKFFTYILPEALEPNSMMQILSTDYKFAVSFSILVIVLLFRPSGIFKGKTL